MTPRTKFLGKALSAAGVLALAIGAFAIFAPQNAQVSSSPIGAAYAQTAAEDVDTSKVFEVELGDADAPVTVIEYASFTCPHCADFQIGVKPELKKAYIDTGKVKLIHREVYFDRYGLWAGMVARCAGPDKYFPMIDLVYKGQRELFSSSDPNAVVENLRRMGRTAGLTDEALDTCLADGQLAQAMVARYQETANADGIEGTPSFVINGKLYSNMPLSEFKDVLDGLLAE